jgi:hypothetical protein
VSKSFAVARKEATGEPLEFDIGGEPYKVLLPLPGMAVLDLAGVSENEGAAAVAAFGEFLRVAIGEAEFQRFHKECLDSRMSVEEILEVVSWLVEETVGRPTEQRSASLKSLSSGTTGSPAAASSAG